GERQTGCADEHSLSGRQHAEATEPCEPPLPGKQRFRPCLPPILGHQHVADVADDVALVAANLDVVEARVLQHLSEAELLEARHLALTLLNLPGRAAVFGAYDETVDSHRPGLFLR